MINLTPEQDRALKKCTINLKNIPKTQTPISSLCLEQISITDSQVFVEGKVNRKTLPHEKGWLWNQSKSKTTIPINDTITVIIAKFNPRKHPKASIESQPAYKLWVCEIISNTISEDRRLHFLWTEKGKVNQFAAPPLVKTPSTSKQTLKLSDYSFLQQFVEPEVAMQLGWCERQNIPQQITYPEATNSPQAQNNDYNDLFDIDSLWNFTEHQYQYQ